ncbi:MAG: cupin domain-containing protein [Rubrobacter sp.]|nr:cupin domain-containing protein [Rubrobacter sp.]
MEASTSPFRATVEDAASRLPHPDEASLRFATVLKRGSLLVELYAPRNHDPQTPHDRDEAYVVVSGSGKFVNGGDRHPFGPGDMLFVPAGQTHRFEDFTDDFQAWVIFCGPQGGEQADDS